MGLGARLDATGERLFDPVEVVNVLKRLGLEGRDSFWIRPIRQYGTPPGDRSVLACRCKFHRQL